MIKLTSTVSASSYFSYAVFNSATVAAEPSAPPDKLASLIAVTEVNVTPTASLPQLPAAPVDSCAVQ
jgi:hypothetical protein